MKKVILIASALLMLASCTQNDMAKNWGGSMAVELPAGQKLVNVTWKDTEMWYLYKPMTATDVAESYTFKEKSTYGIREGKVTLIETK